MIAVLPIGLGAAVLTLLVFKRSLVRER
jgi:hypothetical protein